MTRNRRVDGNSERLDALARRLGAHVIPMTANPEAGFDRLIIRDQVFIVEYKDSAQPPSKRVLTEGEDKRRVRIEEAGGQYHIIESDADMLALFGLGPRPSGGAGERAL